MKRKLILLTFAVALCMSLANSQGSQAPPMRHGDSTITTPGSRTPSGHLRIGVGVGAAFGEAFGVNVSFPIIAGGNFRVEPELGLLSVSNAASGRLGVQVNKYSYVWGKLGIGVFYALPLRGSSNLYFGPRVARLATGDLFSDKVGKWPERKGFLLALSGGLELGSSHLRLGAELRWDYITVKCYNDLYSSPGQNAPLPSKGVVTRSGFIVEAHVSLRAYL